MIPNNDQNDQIAGYHFVLNFAPLWPELAEKAVARARAVGMEVSESGIEIQPRFQGLAFSGTKREDLCAGELRYDVFGYLKDLGGSVVTAIGVTSKHPTYTFGLSPTISESRKIFRQGGGRRSLAEQRRTHTPPVD